MCCREPARASIKQAVERVPRLPLPPLLLSIYVSIYLSIYLSIYIYIYIQYVHVCIYIYICTYTGAGRRKLQDLSESAAANATAHLCGPLWVNFRVGHRDKLNSRAAEQEYDLTLVAL